MIELGPKAKSLLEAARDGDEPTLENRAHVRAAIATRMIVGVGAAAATTAAAKSTAAVTGGTAATAAGGAIAVPVGLATKVVLSVALVGAVGVGTAVIARPIPSATAPSTPALVAPPPARTSAAPHPTNAVPAARATAKALEKATSRENPMAPSPSVERSAPAHAAGPTTDVEAEVRLLGEAHTALQAGDALPALILLDEHARRYPAGALGEERDASRIAALCALSRVAEARAATDRFLRAFPGSPHAARVLASCGGVSQPF